MQRKKIALCLQKMLKSKLAVLIVLFAIFGLGIARQANASSDNYNFATCYQYYMLDNRADSTKNQAGNQKVANIAPLGSGGISGTFSYNDIVNSAPNSTAEDTAKKFVSMMATYSTFNYFSNKVQGFESWGAYIGRFLIMCLLMPLSLIMDFITMLIPAMLRILATFNIIPLLGAVFTNMGFRSGMLDALGMSKDQINAWFNALLYFAITALVIALVMTLRRGSQHIDQRWLHKFEGRLVTLIAVPLVVGGMSTFLLNIGDMLSKVPAINATFSRYLVDDRSWAYNFNFAPLGDNNQKSDINKKDKKGKNADVDKTTGSFVDLSFDPYNGKGTDRIAQINKNSSLAGSNSVFPNTSLLIAYGMSQSFSATDYVNFEGSDQSLHLLGENWQANSSPTYGSYYGYASAFSNNQLLDTHHAHLPSTGQVTNKKDQDGSYTSAIDDYNAGHHELNTSKQNAWRDRYIYGVKNSGNLDKYYGDTPSQEMVKNQVGGTSNATVPSDQSMFLILSTIFEENGGRYYINAPARGIKQVQGQFDSNRSEYYVVSMIGNPFFTLIGMITDPILTLVVLLALLLAIFSVGILDMNIKPFSALFKALVAGDIEYLAAFIFYTLGIGGTAVMMAIMPTMIITIMRAISSAVIKGVPLAAGVQPATAQQSLAFNGMPLIIDGIVSLVFFFIWLRSSKFRDRLNEFFTMPWNWAQAAARRMENSVSKTSYDTKYFAKKTNARAEKPFIAAQRMQEALKKLALAAMQETPAAPVADAITAVDGLKHGNLGIVDSSHSHKPGDDDSSDEPDVDLEQDSAKTENYDGEVSTPDEIKRRGQFDRVGKDLAQIQNDPNISRPVVDRILNTQKSVNEFKAKPNNQTYASAQTGLYGLARQLEVEGASNSQIATVNSAIRELKDIGQGYNLKPVKVESEKPVMSKNTNEIDNDDSRYDNPTMAPDSKQNDSNLEMPKSDQVHVVKPKSERPSASTHDNHLASPDSSQRLPGSSQVSQSKSSVQPSNESKVRTVESVDNVDKPKSEKPALSMHDRRTTSTTIEKSSTRDNHPAATRIVKPKSESPVTVHNRAHQDVLNNNKYFKQGADRIRSKANDTWAKHEGGTNKPVRTVNKSQTTTQKVLGGSGQPGVARHEVKTTQHETRYTQVPKRQIERQSSKYYDRKVKTVQSKPNVVHQRDVITRTTEARSSGHRPVVKVRNAKEISQIVRDRIEKPVIQQSTTNNFVTQNQLKGVISSLGSAAADERMIKPLRNLYQSSNISDVKRNIRGLQKAVRALNPEIKQQINKQNLVENLFELQNSNKFGGK